MNDNEELSFISLAAVTANVTRFLLSKGQTGGEKDRASDDTEGRASQAEPCTDTKFHIVRRRIVRC